MGPPTNGATSLVDILRGLRGLGRAGTVLHLGAHPDDEDAGLLTLVARKHATRVVYWSATRGEGGQNFVGRERGEELGVLRTWESQLARAVDGAEALFGPFIDFGYSKTPVETLRRWGRDAVVRELVRAIRTVQPLIVVSRWSGEERDEHGHHRAVGAVAEEAFDAAGDPSRFPELGARGLAPWQPARLYVSTDGDWQPGQELRMGRRRREYEAPGHARIDPGEYDPWLRRSYQSLAWEAFANHRSQGVAVPPEWGSFYYYYRLARTEGGADRPFHESLFAGLDASLRGLARRLGDTVPGAVERFAQVEESGAQAERCFLGQQPVAAGRALLPARRALTALMEEAGRDGPDGSDARAALRHACARKRVDVDSLIVACLGLHLESRVDTPRVTPAQRFTVDSSLWNPMGAPIERARIELALPPGWTGEAIGTDPGAADGDRPAAAVDARHVIRIPADAELSCPYWLEAAHDGLRYTWPESDACGSPFSPDPFQTVAAFDFEGESIRFAAVPAHVEKVDVGFRRLPVSVVPPVMLASPRTREQLPVSCEPGAIELVVGASAGDTSERVDATLSVKVPDGWSAHPRATELRLSPASSRRIAVRIETPPELAAGRYAVTFGVRCRGREYSRQIATVRLGAGGRGGGAQAGQARDVHVLRPAVLQVDVVDVAVPEGFQHGYVSGADEGVLETLQRLGMAVQPLGEGALRHGDLTAFDSIAIGANAFVLRAEVRDAAVRLLDYVERGGTLIVQHQGYPYEHLSGAPFPFRYHHPHDRVTAPDAPVRILEPDHPLMSFPNRITADDFEGWVRDRGLYFFGEWDPRYRALIETHDPEESPRQGALLVAPHGRGNFVYSGLSFFRQIPAGVHGAIRLFANLLGLPAAMARERKGLLRETYLFAELPDEELDAVARIVNEVSFADGTVIGREGEAGDELYLVVAGEVEILRRDAGEQPIYRAVAGELVGELAVLSHIRRTATMRARGEVRLLLVKGQHFLDLMARHPQVSQAVIRILADKLVHSSSR